MRLDEALAAATGHLATAGIPEARREARLLAAHLLGASPSVLLPAGTPIDGAGYAALVARRAAREPMAFITGRQGFWTLDLAVSRATLIPRGDSETLIEAAVAARPDRAAVRRILDLGTGTGCLLLAALAEFPASFGVGVDLAERAARLAASNAAGASAAVLVGDWGASLLPGFDLILCNPPYIETACIPRLMPEVAAYEPSSALDGGASGLDAYARLMPDVARLLAPDGIAILELGEGQEPVVRRLAANSGLAHVATRHDLGGVERALVLSRQSAGEKSVWQHRASPLGFGSARDAGA